MPDELAGVGQADVGGERPGQAEVADLRLPVGGQQDVGGLQVAVDDPEAVGLGDGPRHRLDQPGGLGGGPRGPVGGVGEAAAGQVFQLEEGDPGHLADAIDLDDVGVPEPGDRLGLGAEPRGGRRAAVPGRERLEGARAIQGDVAGEVDDPHPAAAEFAEHLVPARPEGLPQAGAEPGRRRSHPRPGPGTISDGRWHFRVSRPSL